MKSTFTILMLLVALTSSIFAQTVRDKARPYTPVSLITDARGGGGIPAPMIGLGACDSLGTPDDAGNGNDGVMFEITAAKPIIIQYFDGLFSGDTGHVKIYYKNGSYSGSATTPANWTFVDSALVYPVNATKVRIPINLSIPVAALQTVSFYITGNGTGIGTDYFDGTAEGNIFAQDANLAIKEGLGVAYPFAGNFSPRDFRGAVYYCLDTPTVCQQLNTTLAAGNGNDGAMFTVAAKNFDVLIESINPGVPFGSGTSAPFSAYYRLGSYHGFETTPSAWTFIDSATLTSTGNNLEATGFKNLNVVVPANLDVSFYVTGHGGLQLNYTDGIQEDSLYASDNFLKFYEGIGVAYPFAINFTPRVFNGSIKYCFVGDTIRPVLNITTSASNPTTSASVPVTFEFSKPVTGFDLSDVLASNGSVGPISGSGTTYTSTLTFTSAGLARVIVPAGVASDMFGNLNQADTLEIVYTPVGILEVNRASGFVAGYNRGNGSVYVASLNGELIETVQLLNINGALVSQAAVMRDKTELTVSALPAGIYVCSVTINGVTHNRKLSIY